jgi:predicted nucleic acid-binding protein
MRCVANTGPMVSVFQSESEELLLSFAERVYIPAGALLEYQRHGARELLRLLETRGLVEVIALDVAELERAAQIAGELVLRSPGRTEPSQHAGEADAIALFEARRIVADLLLIDELPARSLAAERGLPVAGFPGLLARLARAGQLDPREVRERLTICQNLGTHYSSALIEEACRLAAREES